MKIQTLSFQLARALTLAAACCASAWAAEPVKIGTAIPLSGPMALSGQNIRRAVDIAVEEINKNGGIKSLGGAPLQIIYADTTSDPSAGASAVARMLSNDRPVAIQGAYGSSITFAASSVSERQGVPFLTMSFSDDIINRGYKNIFQVVATASSMGKAQLEHTLEMAKRAGAEPIKSILIVFEDTAYGKSQAEGLRKVAESLGLQIGLYETYGVGLADAVPLASKVVAAKGQAVFINSTISDAVLIIRALKQLKSALPIIAGGGGFLEPDFHKAVQQDSEGVLVEAPALALGALDAAHRAKYGAFMSHAGFEHAIITEVLAQALEKTASRDPKKLAEALREMTFTSGNAKYMPGGGVKFDARGGNAMTHSVMAQWQGGNLVPVWPVDANTKPFFWGGKIVK
jgi:branched-chain amino acid transport system substrate-binding protein